MSATPDILAKIIRHKAQEVGERSAQIPLHDLRERVGAAPPVRSFTASLEARLSAGRPAVIAELKKASPSKGLLREAFDPAAIAREYQRAGAAAISVLTDRVFFQGDDAHLEQARTACALPCLRKDFVVDHYQVYEARALGADCVLLIVAALGDTQLRELAGLAMGLGMDALVEVHDEEELERALPLNTGLLGINNRDLRTFETSLDTTLKLMRSVPNDWTLVTESGIHGPADVAHMRNHGVRAFLVGEALMTAEDPGERLSQLFALR